MRDDLAAIEGRAHQFGVPIFDGKTHQILTAPDSLKGAIRDQRRCRLSARSDRFTAR
jgi:hypothetical protein